MRFTLVTIGLTAATIIASSNVLKNDVSSEGLASIVHSAVGLLVGNEGEAFSSRFANQYYRDTPGTDNGAVKQTGRGFRDIIDAALDSTDGLAEEIFGPSIGKDPISAGEGLNGIKRGAFSSSFSGPVSSFNDDSYHFTSGIAGNGPGVGTGKSPTKRLLTKRNHGLKYDRAHIRRSSRSSLPQRNQDRVVYKRRSRIDGTKKVELTRRSWKDKTETEYSEEEKTDIK